MATRKKAPTPTPTGPKVSKAKRIGVKIGKFTYAAGERILLALASGRTLSEASEQGGVTRRTVHNWLKRGRAAKEGDRDEPLMHFAVAYDHAMAEHKDYLMAVIRDDPRGGRGPQWLLERRWPMEFARRTIRESVVRHEVEELLERVRDGLTAEQWAAVIASYERATEGHARDDSPEAVRQTVH